jgi:NDP-sugar pyrophosphorylase family protein
VDFPIKEAMILAAGFGERLRPLSLRRPKPLFPVLNRPMLSHWLGRLESLGVREVVVNAYYLKELMEDFVEGNRSSFPSLSIHTSVEDEVLGTGGGLWRAKERFKGPFFVVNADIYSDLSLADLGRAHLKGGSPFTLALVDCPSKATVSVDSEGRILGFREKAPLPGESIRLCGTGIMVLEPELLSRLPQGPSDVIDALRGSIPAGGAPGFISPKPFFWADMGTFEDYLKLNRKLAEGRSHLEEGAEILGELSGFVVAEKGAVAEEGSFVKDSVLWNNAYVEKGARLDSVIAAGRVKAGANLSGGYVVDA